MGRCTLAGIGVLSTDGTPRPPREAHQVFHYTRDGATRERAGVTELESAAGYYCLMNTVLIVLLLLLLLGGGGFYIGGPAIGGSTLGLVLLICLIVYLMGGFRGRR